MDNTVEYDPHLIQRHINSFLADEPVELQTHRPAIHLVWPPPATPEFVPLVSKRLDSIFVKSMVAIATVLGAAIIIAQILRAKGLM